MIWKGSRLHSCNFAGIVLGYCVITNVLKISEAVVNNFWRTYAVKTFIWNIIDLWLIFSFCFFKATTEICLPDNVEQSLLSASWDAKEIVHQLKENLPLNKDVLERPDDDTKKIIRSLAHKAKDLKRLDVFEHLREITPAGATG